MRISLYRGRAFREAFALITVMFVTSVSLVVLVGALNWTSSNTRQTMGNTEYFTTAAAAEAATEKVLAKIISDYQTAGEGQVFQNLSSYASMVPNSTENPYWNNYNFNNGSGVDNRTFVSRIQAATYTNVDSAYTGLKGWSSVYRIISNARAKDSAYNITAAVGQDLLTATIPIFQFAIFYGLDLELHSMTTMDILGRVHSNGHLYTYPSKTTTFFSDLTVVGDIIKRRKYGDPDYSTKAAAGKTVFKSKAETKVASLNLPIGTNNTPAAVRQILEMPPAGESVDSAMGKQRYYNKAELVIIVTNNSVAAFTRDPAYPETLYSVPWTNMSAFVTTNASGFTDQREGKKVYPVEIDVAKMTSWSLTNKAVGQAIGTNTPVNLVYVADNRKFTSSQMGAVRLSNGATLPSRGLTVATPNPLYVKDHFNQPVSSHRGTTNTTMTRPSSLVADAVTLLSGNWADSKSANSYTSRVAQNTTVNAAILTGIVETTPNPGIYSGGAHNLGRFLEDWSGRTLTYNGSMVVLFPSSKATAPFQQPGDYYDPPNREFAFDLNFLDATKLPPGTPDLRLIVRSRWALVPPNKTDFGASLPSL